MNAKKAVVINVIVLIILIGGASVGFYFYNQAVNYVTTDDAKITGQEITIVATANGKLSDWSAEVGQTYDKNGVLGHITMSGSKKGVMKRPIKMPQQATIVRENGVENSFVAAGTPLAKAFNLDELWVSAKIEESSIQAVEQGQTVDITLSAYPDTTLTGHVESIGLATSGTFALLSMSSSSSQTMIPVKISVEGYKGLRLIPGMDVQVSIHKS